MHATMNNTNRECSLVIVLILCFLGGFYKILLSGQCIYKCMTLKNERNERVPYHHVAYFSAFLVALVQAYKMVPYKGWSPLSV